MKAFLSSLFTLIFMGALSAQSDITPVIVNLKDGKTFEASHFGQNKCGSNSYSLHYVIIKGMYLDNVTEIKDYKDIEKIVLEGFHLDAEPASDNEKAVIHIYKKNGVSVTLEEAQIIMSCYGAGDVQNRLVFQITNPLNNQVGEKAVDTRDIQSIVFK